MRRHSIVLAGSLLAVAGSASAATVRADRPRIMFSNGSGPGTTVEQFRQRCSSDPAYQQRCQAGLNATATDCLWPATVPAAGYLVTGDASKCTEAFNVAMSLASDTPGQPDAHSFTSNNGRTMFSLAVARDWCDAALSDEQKQQLDAKIVSYADWYVANAPGLDVYHDDPPNMWNSVALAGLALKGGGQDAKADVYLAAADDAWKNILLPAMAHEGDWWHEGFVYVQPSIGGVAMYALAWSTATDEDIFAYAKTQANDLFEGYLAMHAYAWRPDNKYVYFGDTSDPKQSIELFSRYLVDIMTIGSGSTLGQALSLELKEKSQPWYDYAGANGHLIALWYDATKDGAATPRSTLPTARWLSKGANDNVILRSGWGDADTFIHITCGDYFGAHQHSESGSFQIFRHAQLSGATGYYDNFDSDHWQNYYSQHSVHANTLAVYMPGELFPTLDYLLGDPSKNVNDGGQRVLRRNELGTAFPSPDLATYLANKTSGTMYETGDLTAFAPGACSDGGQPIADYVACDVTAAYSSPGFTTNGNAAKVNEVTRQFVFIRPDILVVFDRVESTDPTYEKRFLLHAASGSPQVQDNVVTITNGPGRLIGQTLLPASADLTVIDNFSVDGVPHPPTTAGAESGGSRVEVSPQQESARDYFLHVLRATDPSATTPAEASVVEDETSATATIDSGGSSVVVKFNKSGEVGGHITVSGICDSDLGAGQAGSSGAGGSGSGGTAGGGSGGGSGSGGAAAGSGGQAPSNSSTPSGDDSGCGCRTAGTTQQLPWAAFALALFGALGMSRRKQ